jgi:hypothetical protein
VSFLFLHCISCLRKITIRTRRHTDYHNRGPSWPLSYGSWIYDYICNQNLSPLMLWVRITIRARSTTFCDNACQWLATGQWFSPGIPVSYTNKIDRHDITETLLKVAWNTIKQTNKQTNKPSQYIALTDIVLEMVLTKNIRIRMRCLQTCSHTTPSTYTPHGSLKSIIGPRTIQWTGVPIYTTVR